MRRTGSRLRGSFSMTTKHQRVGRSLTRLDVNDAWPGSPLFVRWHCETASPLLCAGAAAAQPAAACLRAAQLRVPKCVSLTDRACTSAPDHCLLPCSPEKMPILWPGKKERRERERKEEEEEEGGFRKVKPRREHARRVAAGRDGVTEPMCKSATAVKR